MACGLIAILIAAVDALEVLTNERFRSRRQQMMTHPRVRKASWMSSR